MDLPPLWSVVLFYLPVSLVMLPVALTSLVWRKLSSGFPTQ